jgi:hypothetical protein
MRMILTFLNPFMQAITTSSTNKGEILVGDINTQLKHKNVTTDIKVDTDSNVSSVFLYLGFLFLLFFLIFCVIFIYIQCHAIHDLMILTLFMSIYVLSCELPILFVCFTIFSI